MGYLSIQVNFAIIKHTEPILVNLAETEIINFSP